MVWREGLPLVYEWMRGTSARPLAAEWVPGASTSERATLTNLGGVVAALLNGRTAPTLPAAVTTWLEEAAPLPVELTNSVEDAFAQNPDDFLAGLYADLVLPAHRRRLGTFFTPASEVKLMLSMWDQHAPAPAQIVDVGAGVGVFTAAAARQWPQAVTYAVDINPVTLGLLAARLYGPGQTFSNVRLVHADFTDWVQDADLPGSTLILGNPPYTRAQLLPVSERRRLQSLTGGLCGSRASLSTVITAISLLRLNPKDGLCLLLPAQWLEADYATGLRRTIWESSRRHVELRLVESAMFDEAQVDAVALLISPETPEPGFVAALWDQPSKSAVTPSRDSVSPPNWRTLFAPAGPHTNDVQRLAFAPSSTDGARLRDVARVSRGLATGANGYFTLSAADRTRRKVGRWTRRRIVTRLRDVSGDVINEKNDQHVEAQRWLLEARDHQVAKQPALRAYIEAGERDGVDQRVLCQQRQHWYDLTAEVSTPDVIVGPMTRTEFRFARNELKAAITNNLYGLTWLPGATAEKQAAVLAWLTSAAGQIALMGVARQQGSGLFKIEPKAFSLLELPAMLLD